MLFDGEFKREKRGVMRTCHHCGSKLKKNTKFCPVCGMTVIWGNDAKTRGDKTNRGKMTTIVVVILTIVGVVTFLALGGAAWFKTNMSQTAFSDDPTEISAVSQSVVKLNCYNQNGELHANGSGFACFADGVIVTNYHVIEGGVYSIEAYTENGYKFDVSYVLAVDEGKDIAILGTSSPHNLTLLRSGDSSNLQKGEKVVAIGSPLGLLNSVSTGVFSGYVDENGMDVLQFTAAISNGSSGGALFNDDGEVLGITFASYETGQNLNLAIPIEEVAQLYSNSIVAEKKTIEEFFSLNVGPVLICNNQTKVYHVKPMQCFDGCRGEMEIKYGDNNETYIYLTLSDAEDLEYTMCPDCGHE